VLSHDFVTLGVNFQGKIAAGTTVQPKMPKRVCSTMRTRVVKRKAQKEKQQTVTSRIRLASFFMTKKEIY
jgi:hypothetical protein